MLPLLLAAIGSPATSDRPIWLVAVLGIVSVLVMLLLFFTGRRR